MPTVSRNTPIERAIRGAAKSKKGFEDMSNLKTNWNEINDEEDIIKFMDTFGWFHDSCLKELHLWTDHWVDKDLAMSISPNLDYRVQILFQRQDKGPSAIEMLFEEVTRLHIIPSPENYDSIIFGATFVLKDSTFYWAGDEGWIPEDPSKYGVNWISSKKVRWRDASEWMGSELRYGSK